MHRIRKRKNAPCLISDGDFVTVKEELYKFILSLGIVFFLFGIVNIFIFNIFGFDLLSQVLMSFFGFLLISLAGYLLSKHGYR
jgi:hypothetical protein